MRRVHNETMVNLQEFEGSIIAWLGKKLRAGFCFTQRRLGYSRYQVGDAIHGDWFLFSRRMIPLDVY